MKIRRIVLSHLLVFAIMFSLCATSALAASSTTSQMAANSAAWWVAYNAGDTSTCSNLAAANQALAATLSSFGATTFYNSVSGSWTITQNGNTTTSSVSTNGKVSTVSYSTTNNNTGAPVGSPISSSSYDTSSINSYLSYGGTTGGLQQSYNNAGSYVTATGQYGTIEATTSASAEAAIAKNLLGLSDTQVSELQAKLEQQKVIYENAQSKYTQATTDAEKAAALATMNTAHDAAVGIRTSYGYAGDVKATTDGGYFYPVNSSGDYTGGSYYTTYNITATAGSGGAVSPAGITAVVAGGSQVYTITPSSGYKILCVTVDGVSVGAVATYTFSNVTAAHTITATFFLGVTLNVGTPTVTGLAKDGSIKSGYGFGVSVPVSSNGTVTAICTITNGSTVTKYTMENNGGTYVLPRNPKSVTSPKARVYYIPVATASGTKIKISLSITAVNNTYSTDTKTYFTATGAGTTTVALEVGSTTKTFTVYPTITTNSTTGAISLSGTPVTISYGNAASYTGYYWQDTATGKIYKVGECLKVTGRADVDPTPAYTPCIASSSQTRVPLPRSTNLVTMYQNISVSGGNIVGIGAVIVDLNYPQLQTSINLYWIDGANVYFVSAIDGGYCYTYFAGAYGTLVTAVSGTESVTGGTVKYADTPTLEALTGFNNRSQVYPSVCISNGNVSVSGTSDNYENAQNNSWSKIYVTNPSTGNVYRIFFTRVISTTIISRDYSYVSYSICGILVTAISANVDAYSWQFYPININSSSSPADSLDNNIINYVLVKGNMYEDDFTADS